MDTNVALGQAGTQFTSSVDKRQKSISSILNWLIIFMAIVLIVVLFTIAILTLRKPEPVEAPEGDAFATQRNIENLIKRFEKKTLSSKYSLGDIKEDLKELISQENVNYTFLQSGTEEAKTGNIDDTFASNLFKDVEFIVTSETADGDLLKVFANAMADNFEGFYVFEVDKMSGKILSVSLSVVYLDSLIFPTSGTFEFSYPS